MVPGLLQRNGCSRAHHVFRDQGVGLGTELSRRLAEIARAEKIERVIAEILPENVQM
jgi:L-amino acid N-acyltransferase YncA